MFSNILSAVDLHMITEVFEALTIFCFGLSWPISIAKSIKSRTAKGKSVFFEIFLLIGYGFGIARKIIQTTQGSNGFVFFLGFAFYILNFIEISIDVALYFRNTKLDKLRDAGLLDEKVERKDDNTNEQLVEDTSAQDTADAH